MPSIAKMTKYKVMRPSLIDSVDKINEIIDTINVTEWSDTSVGIYAGKIGHIVVINLVGDEISLAPRKNTLTTLPNELCPSGTFASTVSAGNGVFQLLVDASGEVYIWSNYGESKTGYLRGNLVFYIP